METTELDGAGRVIGTKRAGDWDQTGGEPAPVVQLYRVVEVVDDPLSIPPPPPEPPLGVMRVGGAAQ